MIKKLLIYCGGDLHHKNKQGLMNMINYINTHYPIEITYMYSYNRDDIEKADIIYSPCYPIDTNLYSANKKFIFGPHFSVFPDNKFTTMLCNLSNSVYIQPSKLAMEVWQNMLSKETIPLVWFPFPVDTNKFTPSNNSRLDKIFIYYKRRHPTELQQLEEYLKSRCEDLTYRIFDYVKRYDENEYLNYIRDCKFGIILDAHESQGFAIQEALSCNIPLLVWNVTTMGQEWNGNNYTYTGLQGAAIMQSVPYWDSRCGELFYTFDQLDTTYNKFFTNLDTYTPRDYILENLSLVPCSLRFMILCGLSF